MDTLDSLTKVIVFISTILVVIRNLIEIGLAKFAMNVITMFVPIMAIIWYFFYYAGLYSYRLSEPTFFLTIVMMAALVVSVYMYIWMVWISPKLRNMFAPSEKKSTKDQEDINNNQSSNKEITVENKKDALGGKK